MRTHATKIRNDILSYEAHVNAYKAELAKAPYYLYATGTERSMELLEAADRVYKDETAVCKKMNHIATVFDCAKDMENSLKLMAFIKELLTDFKVLWEANQKVVCVFVCFFFHLYRVT